MKTDLRYVFFLVGALVLTMTPAALLSIGGIIGGYSVAYLFVTIFIVVFAYGWYEWMRKNGTHQINTFVGSHPLAQKEVENIIEEFYELLERSGDRDHKHTTTT